MKKIVDFIIKLLIKIIVILILLLFLTLGYTFFISTTENIALEDTITYLKSFIVNDNNTNHINDNYTDKNLIDFHSVDDFDTNTSDIKRFDNENINRTYFYYNQLDSTSKIIYDGLKDNLNNLKKTNYTIDFSNKFNNLLNSPNGKEILNSSFQSAIDAFFFDHPEIFYIDLTKVSLLIKYTTIGPKSIYNVSIVPVDNKNYLYSNFKNENDVNNAISKIESIRNTIIYNISNTDDYNIALEIHDALVRLLDYTTSENVSSSHNIYGAFINNDVVCEGYAKAYKYILDSLNIECILVNGRATNSTGETELHMWNYIKLNDNWYGVDVTWDDPIVVNGGFTKDIIRHNYFCKGRIVFEDSHSINGKISDEGKTFKIPELSYTNYK